ncbi:unnamed protein product [Rotaria socialis]|uniref:ISXO2-like transposase domain-containing protein n=1 Tax=Rotaria socialis TaxID=392032 RepID=A0A820ZGV4_9BILA|nr:unnamed protein product [Rotaria socialis]CAF4564994.1 unnamed protein product [Rotaria socialis]
MRCVNRDCRNQISARKNTFFSYTDVLGRPNCKLDISTIFEMIWLWCQEIPASRIAALVQVSQPTVVDWLNFLREVCQEAFNDATQMGGVGKIVQIDESLFRGKRKYNRGRLLLGNLNNNNNNNFNVNVQNSSSSSDRPWVFGIAEPTEEGHEVRFFHVARRDAATLIPIIWKHVYPGTTIWSDQWKAYSRLQTGYGYDHETVNHSQNFIDPRTGCHTQLIECLWSHVKTKILRAMRGTPLLNSHLTEYWYRTTHKNMFPSILDDIKRYRMK